MRCEKLVHKHSETTEYVKLVYFLRNFQTSWVNNSKILRIMNAKFSGYCFYKNAIIQGDFQICISLPLRFKLFDNDTCFVILVSLIAIMSNFVLVQLKRCWRLSKFLLREHAFIWNKMMKKLFQGHYYFLE